MFYCYCYCYSLNIHVVRSYWWSLFLFPALFTPRFLIGSFFPRFFSCFLIGPKGGRGRATMVSTHVLLLKSWIFFRLLYAIAKIAIITARTILHLISYPQFTYDLFHMHHSPSYLSREHMNPKLTCSQRQWLHSSVGRASHRYREVTGSNPVEVLNFFQASLRNCKNCDHNCEDHSSFDFISAVHIWFISYASFTFEASSIEDF